jgi:3-phenylpropionate/trans-cinnamate dioxygenase ferredoxin reductase subunit
MSGGQDNLDSGGQDNLDATAQARRIVIVGAGHGGGTAAAVLRQQGFDGEIILIGAEPVGPYHRPPLSKSLLKGELEQPLQPSTFYRDQRIDLRTSTRVVAIDRDAGAVHLSSGEAIAFDVLILATGAKARRLDVPGIDLEKIYELRTLMHARVLYDVLGPETRLVIVGGGWIGLEVAASARSAGVEVTIVEREERLLARVASAPLSQYLTDYHSSRGTLILTGQTVSGFETGARKAVGAVVLGDGRTVACDRALVGIGAVADDDLARAAGLECQDGVVVDERARTSDPRIYAIGDMTRRPVDFHDALFRLESIPSAVEQARQAVAAILSKPAPPPEVPWFWSDQFDLKLQIAGLLLDADAVTVRRGEDPDRLAIFHTKEGRLIATEAVNSPSEFMASKRMIREAIEVDLDRLADATAPLEVRRGAAASKPGAAASKPGAAAPEPAVASNGAAGVATETAGASGKPGFPRATFVMPDGDATSVEATEGRTLMDSAVRNNLPGIIAECGGMCSCGTCHVYVEEPWLQRLPEPDEEEQDMLEFIELNEPNSRLSCQIVMGDDLDGIVVRVPPDQ